MSNAFTIIAPSFSLFKSVSPAEYLAHSQRLLEEIQKYQYPLLAAAAFSYSLASLSYSFPIIINFISPGEERIQQMSDRCSKVMSISLKALLVFGLPYAGTFVLKSHLQRRIDWLQTALNS